MRIEEKVREIHKEIQQNIIKMIPERYKKVCLYASFSDKEFKAGEMFFYYFPNGILKKNPINVYEIAEMFDFEEEQYRKLENRLYESIKKLREFFIGIRKKPWTNITITIDGTKYIVEYNYDNLSQSEFNNYDRHIIWRYKYLRVPIESYTKKEREIVRRYFDSEEYKKTKTISYQESVSDIQVNRSTIYDSVENHEAYARSEEIKKEKEKVKQNREEIKKEKVKVRQEKEKKRQEKRKIKQEKNNNKKDSVKQEQTDAVAETSGVKNQLLNF